MKLLKTIQVREKLNWVYRDNEIGPGGAAHLYSVARAECPDLDLQKIQFQRGPRNAPDSVDGVLDCDLLEIVRDRLTAFQKGPMRSEYNEQALTYVELALYWMNRRVEDRIERGVLGTMEK